MKLFNQLFFAVLVLALGSPLVAQRIVVDSADPSSTFQGTTLNVTIRGKGFSPGAISKFLVTATNSTGRVTVNSTTFISSTALVANITAADDAVISLYDIAVTSNGRTGKGIEKFSVQKQTQDDGIVPIVLGVPADCLPEALVWPQGINDQSDLAALGVVARVANCHGDGRILPFLWVGGNWYPIDLLPNMTEGYAYDVSDEGTVVGHNYNCTQSSCSPLAAFLQDPDEPIQALPVAGQALAYDVTGHGAYIAGGNWGGNNQAILWERGPDLVTWLPIELGTGMALSVSDNGNTIVGYSDLPDGRHGQIWERVPGGSNFNLVDLGVDRFVRGVAPTGETAVGHRWMTVCKNRRCTVSLQVKLPVWWQRSPNGVWLIQDLPILEAGDSAALAVSDVAGRGAVIVGSGNGPDSPVPLVWLLDADGMYGTPIRLNPSDSTSSAAAQAVKVSRSGWVLGEAQLLEGRRAVLWKLP